MAMPELASVTPISDGTARRSDEQVGPREVYVEHRDRPVGYVVWRTEDRSSAEDRAHDVMVRLAGAVGRLDPGRPVWPYLRTIACNLASSHRKRDAHLVEDLDVGGRLIDMPSADADMDDMVVLRSPLGTVIEDAAGAQGWNVADSAESLGIHPRASRQLPFRARRELRAAPKMSIAAARQGRSSCGGRRVQPIVDVRPSPLGGEISPPISMSPTFVRNGAGCPSVLPMETSFVGRVLE